MNYRIALLALVLCTSCGCAAVQHMNQSLYSSHPEAAPAFQPRVSVEVTDMTGNVRLDWDWAEGWAAVNGPEVLWHDQFGGTQRLANRGYLRIPATVGGYGFEIVPHGRLVSIEVWYDDALISRDRNFGIGNSRDDGNRILKIKVQRSLKREADNVPQDAIITNTFTATIRSGNGL